jgi:hypothetical protein
MTSEIDPIDTSRGAEILRDAITLGSPDPTYARAVRQDLADEADEFPYIVFRRIAVERDIGLDGTLLGVRETYHVECWGHNREEEMVLENRVVDLLLAAHLPPRSNDTDGLDPSMLVRAGVIVVDVDL